MAVGRPVRPPHPPNVHSVYTHRHTWAVVCCTLHIANVCGDHTHHRSPASPVIARRTALTAAISANARAGASTGPESTRSCATITRERRPISLPQHTVCRSVTDCRRHAGSRARCRRTGPGQRSRLSARQRSSQQCLKSYAGFLGIIGGASPRKTDTHLQARPPGVLQGYDELAVRISMRRKEHTSIFENPHQCGKALPQSLHCT
ncbi:hypothetical protein BC628DRAFT_1066373 [Trametes gibbosa]|nr:hypothetical protein BC628DRAFT_1066373 [Trametes gibbosa]